MSGDNGNDYLDIGHINIVVYSERIALRREQCGVFRPCKNCNIETRSRDYVRVDEAVFSPCRAELCHAVPSDCELCKSGKIVISNCSYHR
jgi:hypothetical protein